MKPNRMKEKIARGEPALGCSVMFPSPQVVEMLGYAGFDWVLIDCEHGSIGLGDVELMAMACDAVGITPIARPKSNSASDIQSVMDRGVMGVQVPHVNSADDARRAVAAVKFGPGAARGLAAGTRPDSWGLGARMSDFAAAGQRPIPGMRPDRARGSRSATSMRFWRWMASTCSSSARPTSPSPWAFPAIPKAPAVAAAIDGTLAKIVAAGRTPGMPATSENLSEVIGKGCRYIYTHLPRLIGAGSAAFVKAGLPK